MVVIYDGSSPTVDYRNSKGRLFLRQLLTRWVDAFITNNQAGKAYLTDVLAANHDRVFAHPYLVPAVNALQQSSETEKLPYRSLHHPIFLYVGQLIPRKGLHQLLKACHQLQCQGHHHFMLCIIGEGEQRQELEKLIQAYHLDTQVKCMGKVEYSRLGNYLEWADVFVFPSLEDVWGTVVPEALAFGKPVLCSERAGASELILQGDCGYCFDPYDVETLAELMLRFINHSNLIDELSQKAKQCMSRYTPETAEKFLAQVTSFVWNSPEVQRL